MTQRLRLALIAGAVAATTFTIVTFYVSGWPAQPNPAIYLITPTLVLVAYLGVGLIAWQTYPAERVGLLFTVVGYTWLLPNLTQVHDALPFTIGNLTVVAYQGALAHLALAWPYGRLRSRLDRAVVIGNYAWNIGNVALAQLFWDPRTSGCGTKCPANLLLVHSSNRLNADIGRASSLIGLPITAFIVTLIARHWWQTSGYSRPAMTRLVWVAVPIAAYIAVLDIPNDAGLSNYTVYGIGPLLLLSAPAAYAIGMLRTRSARSAVGTALVGLEPGPSPERLRDALARALGDPDLQIALREPRSDRYTDTSHREIHPDRLPVGRARTTLDHAGDALLIYDEQLDHEPGLVRVASAAASLALDHSRLQAEIQAQLEQVRASRARIVEAGDAERRRLERDLHDGAQQRLVTLSLALGMAKDRAAGADPELESLIESASKEAREALIELRELARGIHPAVLTQAGLAGAIPALAERSLIATTIIELPAERFPAAVEATAYFVVSEALANVAKHSTASSAAVTIRKLPGHLVVQVSDEGTGGARPDGGSGLRGLADRVASVGGVLRVDSPIGSGTQLEADIPCT
jgi:signal transduction histidine kinase